MRTARYERLEEVRPIWVIAAGLFMLLGGALVGAGIFLLFRQQKEDVPPKPPPSSYPKPLPHRCASELEPKETFCKGCPPMFGPVGEEKLCASTTRYNDMTKGSCGCGLADPVPPDWWTLTLYTAALNCVNLDPEQPLLSWCPGGCGGCFKLCSTGGTTSGKPNVTKRGVCKVFTVTNRCGDGYQAYPEWCSNEITYTQCRLHPELCSKKGNTNKFGYPAHFDLQDYHFQVSKELGWDNAEVTFEPVSCGDWDSKGHERTCLNCHLVDHGTWFHENSSSNDSFAEGRRI
mmetsp:Transcript_74841/g.173445  ORF Transcript_74841/g.173445 Transcript_74841/m.173445 type:complete len:289 (+) Transcript_74841:121-987(+)